MFVGRRDEVEIALRELTRGRKEAGLLPLLAIHGEEGCGRRSFMHEVGDRLFRLPQPLILIELKKVDKVQDESELASLLAEQARSNHPQQKRILQDVRRELEKKLIRADLPEGKETDGNKVLWSDLLLTQFAASAEETPDSENRVQILFAIDRYDSLPPETRSWIQKNLEHLNRPRSAQFEIAAMVSCVSAFDDVPELAGFWGELPYRLTNIKLGAFSLKETIELVVKSGLSDANAQEVFQKSEGKLDRIITAIAKLKAAGAEDSLRWVEKILRNRTANHRNWLLWSSLLDVVSPESLSVFCNREEAREAFNWIKHFSGLKLNNADAGYRIEPTQAEPLRLWFERNQPEGFRRAGENAAQFQEFAVVVSNPRERNILTLLSLFRYFNTEAIKAVFDPPVEEILQFVEARPDLFDRTDHNHRLSQEYQRIASGYRKLVPPPNYQSLKQKVNDCWEKVRADINQRIRVLEDKARERENSIKDIDQAMVGVKKDIKLHEKIAKVPAETQPEPTESEVPEKYPVTIGVAWEIAGILLLYFSILIPGKISLATGLGGIAMIILGLFIPYQHARRLAMVQSAAVPVARNRERTAELRKNLRILNLKQASLENKKSASIMAIQKYREELEALNVKLQEPYV